MDGLFPFTFWHWWCLGGILLLIELATFTTYFLWIAIAAFATGLLVFLAPGMNVYIQWLCFAIFSVLNVVLFVKLLKQKRPRDTGLNQRAQAMIGQTATLSEPIQNGRGRVQLGDTQWLVKGRDLPEGTQVKITGAEGTWLIVKKAQDQ